MVSWCLIFIFYQVLAVPSTSAGPPAAADATDGSLTIFYDAMVGSCQNFFKSALARHSDPSSRFSIAFVPCQTATFVEGVGLSCATPADVKCTLNKVHSCAIAHIADKKQLVDYLACTMKSATASPNYSDCAAQHQVNNANFQKCITSNEGENLCKAHSEKANIPDVDPLPRFIFKKPGDIKPDDKFEYLDYFISDVCSNQFDAALCAHLKLKKAKSLPQECNKKLVVGIFYKAMDENSQKWFRKMGSIYDTFADHVVFKYQPCMFAEIASSGSLNCKDEKDINCLAGKTHSCAASVLKDNPTSLFKFLNCATKNSTTLPDFQKCATDHGIQYDAIQECALRPTECLLSSKCRPAASEIPSFSYELTFDADTSKKTAEAADLKPVLCDTLKSYGIDRPSDCGQ